jgi:hypothetical protein
MMASWEVTLEPAGKKGASKEVSYASQYIESAEVFEMK